MHIYVNNYLLAAIVLAVLAAVGTWLVVRDRAKKRADHNEFCADAIALEYSRMTKSIEEIDLVGTGWSCTKQHKFLYSSFPPYTYEIVYNFIHNDGEAVEVKVLWQPSTDRWFVIVDVDIAYMRPGAERSITFGGRASKSSSSITLGSVAPKLLEYLDIPRQKPRQVKGTSS